MYGWVGSCEAGHVDRLGHEVIVTEFYRFIIPLWARPRSRYYFAEPTGTLVWVEIPRDARSVALGYARTPVSLAAWMLGFAALVQGHWVLLLGIAAPLAVLALVLAFVAGKLSPHERERRALLQRITGVGMPPELMSLPMREQALDQLAMKWFDEHAIDWRTSLSRGAADELLVALAEYDRSPELVKRARRNLIDAEGN